MRHQNACTFRDLNSDELLKQILESRARTGLPDRPEAVGGDQVNEAMKGKRHGDWMGLGEWFCKKEIRNFSF